MLSHVPTPGSGVSVLKVMSRAVLLDLPNAVTVEYIPSCCGDSPYTHTIKLSLLLLHDCNFVPVMNINICVFCGLG